MVENYYGPSDLVYFYCHVYANKHTRLSDLELFIECVIIIDRYCHTVLEVLIIHYISELFISKPYISMKVFFESEDLASLYESDPDHLVGKQKVPAAVVKQYQKKVNILISITELKELKRFRSLNFKELKGDRKGQYSIRLNKQYRLLFRINKNGELEIIIIEVSKHYE